MAIAGHGGTDIIRQLAGNVVNIFKKKRSICTSACDGMVLKMHYQWSFWLFLAGFSAVWYSWYHRDVITCVSHFNAESQVRLDYLNICLSYPYLRTGEDKRFLLFYRWIHWTLLVLGLCFYIPRKFAKNAENPRLKKLIEDLAVHSPRYDQSEKELLDRAARYICYNLNTHDGIYWKFMGCNVIALAIDIFCFRFLDFVFQGRFVSYGWMAYPYQRDPHNFTDYMSSTFPPFVNCKITEVHKLMARRTEEFGCHLVVMELYEKVFLVVWLWLIILSIITCGYIIFLFWFFHPYFKEMILRVSKPVYATKDKKVRGTIKDVLKHCKIGDVYLLYRLRQHLSHARFYELLERLSNEDYIKTMSEDPADRVIHNKNQENIRNRKGNQGISGQKAKYANQEYYNYPNHPQILVE